MVTPLPTSTARLVDALTKEHAPQDLIDRARSGAFHDYDSPSAFPISDLIQAARAVGLDRIVSAAMNGAFDATAAEAEAWAASDEGQAAFRELIEGSDR